MKLHLRDRILDRPAPLTMGILNVTPDSFSDGGRYLTVAAAFDQARRFTEEGAEIIDVGGESTRPGAGKISVQEELDRVAPVIDKVKAELDVLVSVDTNKAEVARRAVSEAGADMVNDISALAFAPDMAPSVARLQVPVILMHMQGTPETMQLDPRYEDVIGEISSFFTERIAFAEAHGIHHEKILIDPGIGFGKRVEDNVRIVKCLDQFRSFGLPVVIGLSRKSFLGKISGETVPERRGAETLAANVIAALKGAAILRVHEVRQMVAALKVLREIADIPGD